MRNNRNISGFFLSAIAGIFLPYLLLTPAHGAEAKTAFSNPLAPVAEEEIQLIQGPEATYVNTILSADYVFRLHHLQSAEIALALLAREKSASYWVMSLAKRIIKDQTFANKRLHAIADEKNVRLPELAEISLNPRWKKASFASFEEEYLRQVIADQDEKQTIYREAKSQLPEDSNLFSYISSFLPLSQQQRAVAEHGLSQKSVSGM